jgi:hypothetical protein
MVCRRAINEECSAEEEIERRERDLGERFWKEGHSDN